MGMVTWLHEKTLILASKSQARQQLLHDLALDVLIKPASIDERALQQQLLAFSVEEQASALARAKALAISNLDPDHWVIGSDQMLICGHEALHQVKDRHGALMQLQKLNGKEHTLISAACLAFGGKVHVELSDTVRLQMKAMTESDLEHYLDAVGETVFGSVGCYQIEAKGADLFESIKGRKSTIMGMPIEMMIDWMRDRGLVAK
jgi:septum formation protein